MKSQSATEFITTYGFMFLALSLAIAVILFLASYNGTAPSTQCTPFSTISCNFINYYPNITAGYAIATLSFTNSQSVPINITNLRLTIDNLTATGTCSPTFVYPGQESTCIAPYTLNSLSNNLHSGGYILTAGFCNTGVSALNASACVYTVSNYTGTIEVYNAPNDTSPFSVIVATIPSSIQLPAYNSVPLIPSNYSFVQNGDWVPARNMTGLSYAFASSGAQLSYFGINTISFPGLLSALNSNSLPCTTPYGSLLSIAYSVFYLNKPSTVSFSVYGDNSIEAYYKPAGATYWTSVFGGTAWNTVTITTHTATASLGAGTYRLAVEWANTCGQGIQAFAMNGISQ